jgi:2-succinyl-5-enolpyruvyl-6-hydroxy-3-cyclohexene-1-carboxylate synthase
MKITTEKNVQVIIQLLKHYNVKKIIVSPGGTNTAFVYSIQDDPFFNVYSCVDERAAAYLACGLSAESQEPVVISCTGATASRNFLSGLTEAFYRKLPILALTSTQNVARIGHHVAQVIDNTVLPNDTHIYSALLPIVNDDESMWDCELKCNRAFHLLMGEDTGPVHLNVQTTYEKSYIDAKDCKSHRIISKYHIGDSLPLLKGRVVVVIGSHKKFKPADHQALEKFALLNNVPIICDHTSNYYGRNKLLFSIVAAQDFYILNSIKPDVLIHIGEISGDYATKRYSGQTVWRVNEDGIARDSYRQLSNLFHMNESNFFSAYTSNNSIENDKAFIDALFSLVETAYDSLDDLPFSNLWLAQKIAHKLPSHSCIHFAILNSLRSWNYFRLPEGVESNSNVGGFGIDGCLSSLIGASLFNQHKLYYLVTGDLAFFYDLNSLGIRHLQPNVRILLVNNGCGTEFRNYNHHAEISGGDPDSYVSAAGHFGKDQKGLLHKFAEAQGFEYLQSSCKEETFSLVPKFIDPNPRPKPILFEVFTDYKEESHALEVVNSTLINAKGSIKKLVIEFFGAEALELARKAKDKFGS